MPQPSWTDRLTGSAPNRMPRGGLTAAVTAILAGPARAAPGRGRRAPGSIRRQSAGTGSPARSGRSSTVAAAARAFSA